MTFGLITFKSDGTPILTPDGAGGVYVETVIGTAGVGATRTYTGLTGMSLRVFQVAAGSHSWATGVDGSGNPTLTLTPIADNPNGGSVLLVFAA